MSRFPFIYTEKSKYLLIILGTLISQIMFSVGCWKIGLAVFAFLLLVSILKPKTVWKIQTPEISKYSYLWLISLWIMTIVVRAYKIQYFQPIDGLSSRFGFVTLSAINGHYYFPFIDKFEFDETFSAYILVPFILLFGKSWTSFKLTSIFISSLIVPAIFVLTETLGGTLSAVSAVMLLILSNYFQSCDPILSMVRFSLITTIILISLSICLKNNLKNILKTSIFLALLSSSACYLHSQGKLTIILTIFACLLHWGRHPHSDRKKAVLKMMFFYIFFTVLFSTPYIIAIIQNQGYFYFKKRQVFGFHEKYPFSLQGLIENFITLIATFNYRAFLQFYFSDKTPLLNFEAAWGTLGGILLIVRNISNIHMKMLCLMLCLSVFPLILVTPGNWRGLYLSPAVASLLIIAGIWFSSLFSVLMKDRKRISSLLLISFFVIFGFRVKDFYSKPVVNDQITLMYKDLISESSTIPHLFSDKFEQCTPGIPIFEFSKRVLFKDCSIFKCQPLRVMIGYEYEEDVHAYIARHSKKVVFIIPPEDDLILNEIIQMFPEHEVHSLKYSKALSVTVWEHDSELIGNKKKD